MGSENKIIGIKIRLNGFTKEEYQDILKYIRSVEAYRKSRKVIVSVDTSGVSAEEGVELVKELYPDDGGPPFMMMLGRNKDESE